MASLPDLDQIVTKCTGIVATNPFLAHIGMARTPHHLRPATGGHRRLALSHGTHENVPLCNGTYASIRRRHARRSHQGIPDMGGRDLRFREGIRDACSSGRHQGLAERDFQQSVLRSRKKEGRPLSNLRLSTLTWRNRAGPPSTDTNEDILDDARLQSRTELLTPRGGSIRRMKS